ncbi:MAG TPA: hypothetical protein VK469_00590, partial [Candidatus Kapabacteria bacterium]|nr:hypothetical protein [Candidatus Kapabacteria bacterium]
MNKIRFGFLAIVLIISIAAVITFNVYKNPLDKTVARVSDFKITQVAGSGGLYVDTNPIKKEEIFLASKVDIKQMHYSEDIYVATDRHTAFEFYFSGASFIAMPDSYLNYQPGSNTLRFIEGEFIWHKEIADSPIGVSLVTASQVITLSSEGKVSIKPTGAGIQIWNYAGELKYNDGSATFSLQPNTFLASARNQRPLTASLLEAPGFISPEEKEITVNQPGDSAVKFSWKEVTGARGYIFRVYSSKLMENILYEKEVDANWIGLDLLQFADFNTLYWQVYAYDSSNERQGVPSKMGFLKINGVFFNKESILKP